MRTDGEPIAGARLEIWMADDEGIYDVQYADRDHAQGRGHMSSADEGGYWFWSVLPEAYPIPHDGPVGDLLKGAGRRPWRPAHLHFQISAPGYKTLHRPTSSSTATSTWTPTPSSA